MVKYFIKLKLRRQYKEQQLQWHCFDLTFFLNCYRKKLNNTIFGQLYSNQLHNSPHLSSAPQKQGRFYQTSTLQQQQKVLKSNLLGWKKSVFGIMGGANCKEYSTTSKKKGKAGDTEQSGTYQSEGEMSEYTGPVEVCHIDDLQENEMKQFQFDVDTKVLVAKQGGQIFAIGNKCPHYGAPLNTGALGQGRVRCPWHGAAFDLRTGDIEDFPGVDSLPCFMVRVENDGKVKLRAKRTDLENNKRVKDMVKRDKANNTCMVVIGGGPAGGICVETLRQEGFTGRIVMLCREKCLPYDRVKLTKTIDVPLEKLEFRKSDFYAQYDIEVMLGVAATKVDTASKTVICSNNEEISYDKLFICTGLNARKPPVQGTSLKNVFTVREYDDARAILAAITPETRLVCVGGSFISMEMASTLHSKVKSVTIVYSSQYPFSIFGEPVGELFYRLYREKGIIMKNHSVLLELNGNADGVVTEVELVDGSKYPCDVVVLGTGSTFNTDFLRDSGIKVNSDGSIDTDMHLMTNVIDVYVGGDIAKAPVFAHANQRSAIGHIQLAQYHGRVAALNMTGTIEDLKTVPFFFSNVFGKGIRYAGYGRFTEVIIKGDLENWKFVAYYLDSDGKVLAVLTVGHDPVASQFGEFLYQGKHLHRSQIEEAENHLDWTNMLKEKNARPKCDC
ncbi:apoptosis-inducing factor 3-like isoform X3 [Eurosta solidaginis]|uniref:apoptosis-inducing factor 3-like isoform X3 n=1 Tax=Eurosta solidaginis TaxID=178769 RepID=UPI00353070D1